MIHWDLSLNNVFYLTGGQGIGIQSSPTNSHQSIVYAKAYQAIHDINSGSNMTPLDAWNPARAYSTLYSTINVSTTSWMIYPSICSPQQTLYWNTNPIKFLVTSGVSSINTDYITNARLFSTVASTCISSPNFPLSTFLSTFYNNSTFYDEVNIDSVNSTIRFLGVRDVQLSTLLTPQRSVFFSISTFTSEGYLGLSGEISSLRGLSTTMPYHYRSSILLNKSNAFLRNGPILDYLSTTYRGTWTTTFTPLNGGPPIQATTSTLTSSIGFPYAPGGFRGTNVLSSSNLEIPVGSGRNYRVDLTENNTNVYTGDAYISSFTFNMGPFSTIINRNNSTSITLDYTPNFLLAPNSTIGNGAGVNTNFAIGFSTFLSYGGVETVPGTIVEDLLYTTGQYPVQNPVYARLRIDIPKEYVSTHYLSNYSVYHYFPNAIAGYSNSNANVWPPTNYLYNRAGLSSPQIMSYTSRQNVAYITIIGH